MRLGKVCALLICIGSVSLACKATKSTSAGAPTNISASWHPPSTFQEADLIGTWEEQVKTNGSTESLMLAADHTFKQIYDVSASGYHFETQGEWRVEYRSSGCVYIHAKGMRYYYGIRSEAEAGNRDSNGKPVSFWDPCENRLIEMPDSVTLIVISNLKSPNGILLAHMALEADSSTQTLQLVSTAISTPGP
jgi:hypothetical protein